MGIEQFNTLIVHGFVDQREPLESIRAQILNTLKKRDLYVEVTEIVETQANGWLSFFVFPSGSKQGWKTHDVHLNILEDALATAYNYGVTAVLTSYGEKGISVTDGTEYKGCES